jgi:hypothetical protein
MRTQLALRVATRAGAVNAGTFGAYLTIRKPVSSPSIWKSAARQQGCGTRAPILAFRGLNPSQRQSSQTATVGRRSGIIVRSARWRLHAQARPGSRPKGGLAPKFARAVPGEHPAELEDFATPGPIRTTSTIMARTILLFSRWTTWSGCSTPRPAEPRRPRTADVGANALSGGLRVPEAGLFSGRTPRPSPE